MTSVWSLSRLPYVHALPMSMSMSIHVSCVWMGGWPDPPTFPPLPAIISAGHSLTPSLRRVSAPALISDSTQLGWPVIAAQCSAVTIKFMSCASMGVAIKTNNWRSAQMRQ